MKALRRSGHVRSSYCWWRVSPTSQTRWAWPVVMIPNVHAYTMSTKKLVIGQLPTVQPGMFAGNHFFCARFANHLKCILDSEKAINNEGDNTVPNINTYKMKGENNYFCLQTFLATRYLLTNVCRFI